MSHTRAIIQNSQDGYRELLKNTLDQQVYTTKPTDVIHRHFYMVLDVFCWYEYNCRSSYVTCFDSLTGCMSVQWRLELVSFLSICTAPWVSKLNQDDPDFFVLRTKSIRMAGQGRQ